MKRLSLLTLLLISSLLLTAERCSKEHKMPDSLFGSWVHSHEEDYGGNQVYRHPSFNFPASRGRERFDMKPEGVILYYGIAPNDGAANVVEGKWRAINERSIDVSLPQGNGFSADLVEIANDRLVIRKLPEKY